VSRQRSGVLKIYRAENAEQRRVYLTRAQQVRRISGIGSTKPIHERIEGREFLHRRGDAGLVFFQYGLLHGGVTAAQGRDYDELMLMQILHGGADRAMQVGQPLLGATTGRLLHTIPLLAVAIG